MRKSREGGREQVTSDLVVHGKELVCTEWGGTGFRTERCAIWNRERPLAAVESRLDKGHEWRQGNWFRGYRCHPDKG